MHQTGTSFIGFPRIESIIKGVIEIYFKLVLYNYNKSIINYIHLKAIKQDLIMINSENSNTSFEIVSFYNFIKLDDESINKITEQLENLKNSIPLKGLIIIAPEGLNGTVSTHKGLISEFTNYLNNSISNSDWKFKYSISNFPPFKRFSIKIRDEIVTSGYPELKPDIDRKSVV
jgi:hypothetical protein